MTATRPTYAWSLCQELGALELAVQGSAGLLAQVYELPADERTAKALAFQAEAMLTLVHLRLRDLGRVLRGELDPAMLTAPHNIEPLDGSRTNPGEDVVFASKADARDERKSRRAHR